MPPAEEKAGQAAEPAREVQMVYLPPPPVAKPPTAARTAAGAAGADPTPTRLHHRRNGPPRRRPRSSARPSPTPTRRPRPPAARARSRDRRSRGRGADRRQRSQGRLPRAGRRERGHDGVRGPPDLRPPAARHPARRGTARDPADGGVPAGPAGALHSQAVGAARFVGRAAVRHGRGQDLRQDNGLPLAGAHLQMLGTPYVSFTNDVGEYSFRFDMSLVDNCRTQYVRVTAPGYESRLLVLMVGPNVRSDDVLLKKR